MIAVVNLTKITDGVSTVASNRIALYIAQKFGANLIDRKESCYPEKYETIFIVNGPSLYCQFRPELEALCAMNEKFVWVGNDYAIVIYTKLRRILEKKQLAVMAAYENFREWPVHHLVNWNQLTFLQGVPPMPVRVDGLSYYGAWRDGREEYFRRYLSGGLGYQVNVSASARALPKFQALNPRLRTFDLKDNVVANVRGHQAVLYIEDERTHRVYCSPANRFYECLSAGVPQMFDASCVGTFRRAGLDISPWVVSGPTDVKRLLQSPGAGQEQLQRLGEKDFRALLDQEFLEACRAFGIDH